MIVEAIRYPFQDIPDEFLEVLVDGPEVRDTIFIVNRELRTWLYDPVIERIKGYTYRPDPSIALIVSDLCFFRRFDPESDFYSGESPDKTKKSIECYLSYFDEEKKEKLLNLVGLSYDSKLDDKDIVYEPFERRVMLYSENSAGRKHFTVYFNYLASFFLEINRTKKIGDVEIFHNNAQKMPVLLKSHRLLIQDGTFWSDKPIESDELAFKALETLDSIKRYGYKTYSPNKYKKAK